MKPWKEEIQVTVSQVQGFKKVWNHIFDMLIGKDKILRFR